MRIYKGYQHLLIERKNKVLLVKFNNPSKKNSLSNFAYDEIGRLFREASNDDNITIIVVTGQGDTFTCGNDLSQPLVTDDIDSHINKSIETFKNMISALIDCPKVVIALVNGPCIGIGVTLACLCDLVWCSETAYFYTPFVKLGIVPEGCSSFLFPLIMGRSKATEMLLFSEKLDAQEALRYNLASKLFKEEELLFHIWPKIHEYSELPPKSLQESKKLVRMQERESLYKAMNAECQELRNRFYSDEFLNALLDFSTRKRKSSKL